MRSKFLTAFLCPMKKDAKGTFAKANLNLSFPCVALFQNYTYYKYVEKFLKETCDFKKFINENYSLICGYTNPIRVFYKEKSYLTDIDLKKERIKPLFFIYFKRFLCYTIIMNMM